MHTYAPKSDGTSSDEKVALSSDSLSTAVKTYENLCHDKVEKPSAVAESGRGRRARIFVPARAATQAGISNTKSWAVELDNRERWEEPLIGWCASADPSSSIGTFMKFARKEDAIFFCERQGWEYEVDDPHLLNVKPKAYGSNFSWNKKTRVSTK
uniref:NADH dehydrogenase [ubiquinone] iron-sulfur protein 4, mitochondrial n=1 Tax=Romanomermis culicivorax TaxID=13658 RepID=A0A915HHZ7_ROMCU